MAENAKTIWADGPVGAPTQPDKSKIRDWGTSLEAILDSTAQLLSASVARATKAELDAVVGSYPNGSIGVVVLDSNTALRGIYQKVSGVWVKKANLPAEAAEAAQAAQAAAEAAAGEADDSATIAAIFSIQRRAERDRRCRVGGRCEPTCGGDRSDRQPRHDASGIPGIYANELTHAPFRPRQDQQYANAVRKLVFCDWRKPRPR